MLVDLTTVRYLTFPQMKGKKIKQKIPNKPIEDVGLVVKYTYLYPENISFF